MLLRSNFCLLQAIYIADASTKFNRALLLSMDSNSVQRPIRGHLITTLLNHILTASAKFDSNTGYLLIHETFIPLINRLPAQHQHLYRLDELRLHFGGVRFWGKFLNGWLGGQYLQEFARHLRTVSNIFFDKHPSLLRKSTINNDDGTTPSSLDRPSEL